MHPLWVLLRLLLGRLLRRLLLGLRCGLSSAAGQRPPHAGHIQLPLCVLPRLPLSGLSPPVASLSAPPAGARPPLLLRAQQLVGQLSKARHFALQAAAGKQTQRVGAAASRRLLHCPARWPLLRLAWRRRRRVADPAAGSAGTFIDAPLQLGLHRVGQVGAACLLHLTISHKSRCPRSNVAKRSTQQSPAYLLCSQ